MMAKITGKEGPAVNDQGTPIEEVRPEYYRSISECHC